MRIVMISLGHNSPARWRCLPAAPCVALQCGAKLSIQSSTEQHNSRTLLWRSSLRVKRSCCSCSSSRSSERASLSRTHVKTSRTAWSALQQVAVPNQIVTHRRSSCEACQGDFPQEIRQLIERCHLHKLPEVHVQVIEHHIEAICCPACGNKIMATFPQCVDTPPTMGRSYEPWRAISRRPAGSH